MPDLTHYEEQAEFIMKNLELVFDNIHKNKHRLCSVKGILTTKDYENIAVYAFGNWVRPKEIDRKITYRLIISTENKPKIE